MSYQELMRAVAEKLAERIEARRSELYVLDRDFAAMPAHPGAAEGKARVATITRQIARMATALSELAEAAGTR